MAVYWVTRVDAPGAADRPAAAEIWRRFPKFILGFVGASLLFSFVLTPALGDDAVAGIIDLTSDLRGWLFCLAFASIGLESNFRALAGQVLGGPAHSALRRGPGLQPRADPARGLARVRRGPLRSGVMRTGNETPLPTPRGRRQKPEAARTARRRMLALAALALLLSQAVRLPGPAGDAIRGNAAADRDATALFYTEVDGWPAWGTARPLDDPPGGIGPLGPASAGAAGSRAGETPDARRSRGRRRRCRHPLNSVAARSRASRSPTSTAVSPGR